jgi:penicillin-binding protein 1A
VTWTKNKTLSGFLKRGDVIFVTLRQDKDVTKPLYDLQQMPLISGGLIALDPHTGRVLAMVGGFNYEGSEFNRATQAKRQPGSTFKPFIYLAGLENGYQPNTIILDAPISIYLGPGLGIWRPSNYKDEFYGPTTMRVGLEKSRNSMTVRIAQAIGMKPIQDVVRRFGIMENMPARYSAVLGALEVNLLQMTSAYAVFVNGGKKVTPTLIDRIQDRTGKNIYKHDTRECPQCNSLGWDNQKIPEIPDNRPQITDAGSAYQMISMLQGVVRAGTGSVIGKSLPDAPLAGKTGTTNDNKDVWFVGFSPDLVVGLYMGFDNPRSLGKKVTGGSNAAPVFRDFMELALKDNPPSPFRVPPDIRLMRVSHKTGRPAGYGDKDVIFEAFKKQKLQEPQKEITGDQPVAEENFDKESPANDSIPMGSDESVAPKDAGVLNGIY